MSLASSISRQLQATVSLPAQPAPSPEDAKDKAHHVKPGSLFKNPWPSFVEVNGLYTVFLNSYRRLTGQTKAPDITALTVVTRKAEFLPTRETSVLRATWLGHACYYVEYPSGLRVLFDPVFEERCSPVTWFGPKRFTKTPCEIKDIPFVDACVISHAHYDHLSSPTIREIQNRHPECHFFAPLGNKRWFEKLGIPKCTEMDWWEDRDMVLSRKADAVGQEAKGAISPRKDEIVARISCLPSQHESARGPFDKNRALWASWAITSGDKSVWFAGDTGYRAVTGGTPESEATEYNSGYHRKFPACPAFKQIGQLRGPFDLGLIPIGSYSPRFLYSNSHANPYDSVNIFVDTKCKRAMAMHWGAWVIGTLEPVMEPPKALRDALRRKKIPEEGVFDICEIGESRNF